MEDLNATAGARKRTVATYGNSSSASRCSCLCCERNATYSRLCFIDPCRDDEEPKFYDPNLELIKSGDWGANIKSDEEYRPATIPDRPGSLYVQRMELTLGRTTNKPRDRPHTKMSVEPDPSNIKLPPIKKIPEHMKSPKFMKQREDKAFNRSTNRLTVTNRKAIEQLSASPR